MIYPHKIDMTWGGFHELEPRDLPEWALDQPLQWTISSGQGTLLDIGSDRVRFTGPAAGPAVPDQTVIHLYVGEDVVGECVVTLATVPAELWRVPSPDLPPEPEPEPPPEDQDIQEPVDCGKDPTNPREPLVISPTHAMIFPLQMLSIVITRIWEVCEDGCYTWELSWGGGKLLCNCGREAIYQAPRINEECEHNAQIDLIYNFEVIATCHIIVNTWGRRGVAYAIYQKVHHHWETGQGLPSSGGASPWPKGVLTASWYIRAYGKTYDCQDEIVREFQHVDIPCHCGYSSWQGKWLIKVGEYAGVGGSYEQLADIPLWIIDGRYPARVEDRRTAIMKAGGCCPMGLEKLLWMPDEQRAFLDKYREDS